MTRLLFTSLASTFALATISTAIDYGLKTILPTENWMAYQSLQSIDMNSELTSEYQFGDRLRFRTTDRRNKYIRHVIFYDTLMCRPVEGTHYIRISDATTESRELDKTPGWRTSDWTYQGRLPNFTAICYLYAKPTVQLRYGITKSLSIRSNDFKVHGLDFMLSNSPIAEAT